MSVRLPHKMLEDLKRLAGQLSLPYQTLMKQAIDTGISAIREQRAPELRASERKLRREIRMSDTPHVNDSLNKLSTGVGKKKSKKKAAAKK